MSGRYRRCFLGSILYPEALKIRMPMAMSLCMPHKGKMAIVSHGADSLPLSSLSVARSVVWLTVDGRGFVESCCPFMLLRKNQKVVEGSRQVCTAYTDMLTAVRSASNPDSMELIANRHLACLIATSPSL